MEEKEELQEKSNPPQDQIVAVIGTSSIVQRNPLKVKQKLILATKKSVEEIQISRRGGSLAA